MGPLLDMPTYLPLGDKNYNIENKALNFGREQIKNVNKNLKSCLETFNQKYSAFNFFRKNDI